MNQLVSTNKLCNLCGLPCNLVPPQDPDYESTSYEAGGLINAVVAGGYYSTPGNGEGALDDMVGYHFSLCEFCLDWLFTQFKIPVKTEFISDKEEIKFKPAIQRVLEEDWRKDKEKFFQEYLKRADARSKEHRAVDHYRNLLIFK